MSKKCKAYSESKLGLEPADNRKAFYAGWDAALAEHIVDANKMVEQPAQQWCMRCNTPKKCELYGCSPLTWPAEQPAQQQEPVAWWDPKLGVFDEKHFDQLQPLYLYPAPANANAGKPWVGLTDEEKSDLWCESTGRDCVNEDTHVFADAIEAKLREKNNG